MPEPPGIARPAHGHGSSLFRETGEGANETRQYYGAAAGVEPGRAVTQNTRVSDASWSKPKSNSQISDKTATTSTARSQAILAPSPREGHRGHRGPSSRHGPDSDPLVHRPTRRKSTGDLDDYGVKDNDESPRLRLLQAPHNRNRIVDRLAQELRAHEARRGGAFTIVAAAPSGMSSIMGARCPHGRRTSSPSIRATGGNDRKVDKPGERPKKMGATRPAVGTATNAAPDHKTSQGYTNCTVQPGVDRRTLHVWEEASAGRDKAARTQGDLLLRQRARGVTGSPYLR